MAVCGLVTLCIGVGLAWFLALDIPDIRSLEDYRPLVATEIQDREGKPMDVICRQYRILVRGPAIPPLLRQAFVAAEDARYYSHPGIDLLSILRAAVNNLRSGRRSQGGSTITQQVTRALMLSREKTYWRKLAEAILAYRLDRMLSKDEVLTIYLNEIYLGEGAYGVEAAARTYFGRRARELSLAQMALLAGLPQSPSRYSPFRHLDAARARQRYVLNRMAEDGIITPVRARQAFSQPLGLRRERKVQAGGYFTDYVRGLLIRRYGEERLYREGFSVRTTLDRRLQRLARRVVLRGCRNVARRQGGAQPQGALVALETTTGRILALVGGTGYRSSPYNRAVVARRQPGSVFKPFIYGAAFARGLTPDTVIRDAPLAIRNKDGTLWRPRNYSHRFYGPTTLREALVHSRNIVTIKLLQRIGVGPVQAAARAAGIRSPLKPELTLALGASPVTLLEMTGAYTVFANQGVFHPPRAIIRVHDHRAQKTISWPAAAQCRVFPGPAAESVRQILAQVISRGTGRQARGIRGACGKTGTSDDNRDAWFIGFTRDLTVGVWLGHDRDMVLGRGETGGRAAAPVWKEFMEGALEGLSP